MTLLEQYIHDMNRDYREPERRGTQKGHGIGVFHGRFNAAMYSLYAFEQKEIANRAGISYAFFRKLRTEENFKRLVKGTRKFFVDDYLFWYLRRGEFVKQDRITVSPEIAFADVATYDYDLKKYIAKCLIHTIRHDEFNNILGGLWFIERLFVLMTKWKEPKLNKAIFSTFVRVGIDLICSTIDKKEITSEMRNQVFTCSQFILKISRTL